MGRRKCYATPADRQAAYRRRLQQETVLVDRKRLAQQEATLQALHAAILSAKRAGHRLAQQVGSASSETTVEALTAWFTAQGEEGSRSMT